MKRKDLQDLARLRLKEAELLLRGRCGEGAYYLAGYAVECAIKACIAKQTERHEFPDKDRVQDSWTHDFVKLVRTAGFADELKESEKRQPELNANWTIVRRWNEKSRYQRSSLSEAEQLINAISDRSHGVLPWLRRRW